MSYPQRWPLMVIVVWLAWAGAAPGQDGNTKEAINQAIERGVSFLKGAQATDGLWPQDGGRPGQEENPYRAGAAALAGWALLESGVPANDAAIQKTAAELRKRAIREYNKTYNLAFELIFFDRLGDPEDIPFIEALAARLLAAQDVEGGWGYGDNNEQVSQAEQQWLGEIVSNRKNDGKEIPARAKLPRTFRDVSPLIQQRLAQIVQKRVPAGNPFGGRMNFNARTNVSTTQVAMMSMRVARRYGLPVDPCLVQTAKSFGAHQLQDGSWNYMNIPFAQAEGFHGPSWTCAGLLAYALGTGLDARIQSGKRRANLMQYQSVQHGMAYLGKFLHQPAFEKNISQVYYFLWSLERMAVVYDVKKVDDIDWYAWGAEWLLKNQAGNGGWPPNAREWNYGHSDTSFALLFLKRANVAADLTDALKGQPKEKAVKTKPKDDFPVGPTPVIVPKDRKKRKTGSTSWQGPRQPASLSAGRLLRPPALARHPAAVATLLAGRPFIWPERLATG